MPGHHAQRHIAPIVPLLPHDDAITPVRAGQPQQPPTIVIAFAFTIGKASSLAIKQEIRPVLAIIEQHLAVTVENGERQRVVVLLAAFTVMHQLLGFRQAACIFVGQKIPQIGGRQAFGEQHLLGIEHFVDVVARHHPRHQTGGAPGQ
ncbi:hypothetical protein D3C72_1328570 [compost metagenome]